VSDVRKWAVARSRSIARMGCLIALASGAPSIVTRSAWVLVQNDIVCGVCFESYRLRHNYTSLAIGYSYGALGCTCCRTLISTVSTARYMLVVGFRPAEPE
jgi:hypothetical protein